MHCRCRVYIKIIDVYVQYIGYSKLLECIVNSREIRAVRWSTVNYPESTVSSRIGDIFNKSKNDEKSYFYVVYMLVKSIRKKIFI